MTQNEISTPLSAFPRWKLKLHAVFLFENNIMSHLIHGGGLIKHLNTLRRKTINFILFLCKEKEDYKIENNYVNLNGGIEIK